MMRNLGVCGGNSACGVSMFVLFVHAVYYLQFCGKTSREITSNTVWTIVLFSQSSIHAFHNATSRLSFNPSDPFFDTGLLAIDHVLHLPYNLPEIVKQWSDILGDLDRATSCPT